MKSVVAALALTLGLTNVAFGQSTLRFIDHNIIGLQSDGTPLTGKTPDLENTYFDVRGFYRNAPNGTPLYGREFLRLGDVLRAAGAGGVTQEQLEAGLAPIAARQEQLSVALAGIANRLDRITDRFREGVALAGSINVLPPNPGDRFAVSFGGAGYEGVGAGSVSVSARLREDIIAYGAVARGPSQTLVKGGVGFSFR